ncbi:transcriptional regulator with XRE-family HTH domain [Lactobacillus colini]|uniref:Transcriptional regulator with XRE-family HTH domain n=1 Tax=Lactobacillus colini TaxID=1819254 RepID=A0ABS4MBD9_9LACO|nr:transcriptional regulator with XRE-family HTH domain [Lactobacillus colini]
MSNRIKELRKKKNLTLRELGEALKMRDNTLSQYENEKRNPKKETWQKLADFFGVSISYLQGFNKPNCNLKGICLRCGFTFYFEYHLLGNEHFICPKCGCKTVSIEGY